MSHLFWYPGYELKLKDIVRADNCHLFDGSGNKYLDLESGVWCTSVGHGNPRVLKVLKEQSTKIIHTGYNYSSPIVEETAEEFLSLFGFEGGRCVFLCSGSEAVEFGVRVAREIIGPSLLMTMADSYFGAYGSASIKSKSDWFCFDWSACENCPDEIRCEDSCEHWAAIPKNRIGGFLFEPGSSSGQVRFPPEKLISSIDGFIKKNEGVILVNEVTTGVGRTGKWFGYQHYGIRPDIVGLGKGIGNGYPISVTAFAPRIIDRLGDKQVKYAQSHQNDPLGAAIALEVVQIIKEERLIERCNEISDIIKRGFDRIRSRTDRIKEIRARGMLTAIEIKDDDKASLTTRIQKDLVHRGFLVAQRPGLNILRIDPALTIAKDDIEVFLLNFEQVLTEA
ncbi:MAG: aminotransferase class III-fold pyridoxal phosphate-dependent enzyme [Planctomycetes bacterium]|nr:aminotransferase class III-fold pyridoxal phosphate-dependent enzyme [Planctomycetota bacterium]